MATASNPKPSRVKVREHRERLRGQGLRPIQIWVQMSARPPSGQRRIANRWPWPPVPMLLKIRRSSTPCPLSISKKAALNEAG